MRDAILGSTGGIQLKAKPALRWRDFETTIVGRACTQQHPFDSRVVVEVFQVSYGVEGSAQVNVQRRSAVRGEWDLEGFAYVGSSQKARDAAAARRIELHDIDCARLQHVRKVAEAIAVLTGCDVHS
ncbi:MAG TPA: hypothetical protein VGL19_09215, partial [Polyangiaceae bacterium]